MANTIPSPNMGMPVPVVGVDPGPDWAQNINASLSVVDGHDHSPGHGVQVTPAGININADFAQNGNNITLSRTIRFLSQSAALTAPADLECVYVVGQELFYNDGAGNTVQITTNGSVNAGAGSITGLPSGTASASFAGGTFTFVSATNTPAAMNLGSVKIGRQDTSGFGTTIGVSGSQAANYSLTLPTSLPGSTSLLQVDSSGNMGTTAGITGSGAAVLANSPTISSPTLTGAALSSPTLSSPTINGTVTGTPTLNVQAVWGGAATLNGTVGGNITWADQQTFSTSFISNGLSATFNSGLTVSAAGINITAGGLVNRGGGNGSQVVYTAVFTGTLNAGQSVQLSPSGANQLIGVSGFWKNLSTNNVSGMGAIILGSATPNNGIYFNNGSTTNVQTQITNFHSTNQCTYWVTVHYQ